MSDEIRYVENHPVTVKKTGWLCPLGHVHPNKNGAEACWKKHNRKPKGIPKYWYRAGFAVVARETGWTYRKIGEHFGIGPTGGDHYTRQGERFLRRFEMKILRAKVQEAEEFKRGMDEAKKMTKPSVEP